MSEKNCDQNGRWRSKTVGFRMSPEEDELLNQKVRLSGLNKQDYIILSLLTHKVVVYGNPRVFAALRKQIEALLYELQRIQNNSEMDDVLKESIQITVALCAAMMEQASDLN